MKISKDLLTLECAFYDKSSKIVIICMIVILINCSTENNKFFDKYLLTISTSSYLSMIIYHSDEIDYIAYIYMIIACYNINFSSFFLNIEQHHTHIITYVPQAPYCSFEGRYSPWTSN